MAGRIFTSTITSWLLGLFYYNLPRAQVLPLVTCLQDRVAGGTDSIVSDHADEKQVAKNCPCLSSVAAHRSDLLSL
jgi:hypothetical protein